MRSLCRKLDGPSSNSPKHRGSEVALGLAAALVSLCALLGTFAPTCAQPTIGDDFGVGIVGAFDPAGNTNLVTISSQFTAPTSERPAVLMITARIAPGWHVFAITQPPGGPQATKIRLTPSTQYQQIGPFRAMPAPKSHIDETVWVGLELEEHEGEVTWYAPIELAPGVDPAQLEIQGTIDWQVCKESCIPGAAAIQARLGSGVPIGPIESLGKPVDVGPLPEPTFEGSFQLAGSEVKISGHLEPAVVRPGQSARLVITAAPSPGWHVYAYSPYDNKPGSKPTLIAFQTLSGLIPSPPTTDTPVKVDSSVAQFGPMRYHEGPVTWETQIDVPVDAPPGEYPIRGLIGYQACESRSDGRGSCELARAVQFESTLEVGEAAGAAESPLTFAAGKSYNEVAIVAATWADAPEEPTAAGPMTTAENPTAPTIPQVSARDPYDLSRVRVEAASGSLAYYIALAFVGGLILNLMPCVLPVIGLKVMSFVEQAGKSRSHALVLNLWYAAGIVSVFLLLGLLACLPQLGLSERGLGWGGQFGNTAFNVTIAAIVFAMALSLLGVWEVPIPGFFGSGSVQSAAAKEGPLGAFLKGVVTTVLATPCTAPFMATAIAWAVAQPVATTLIVFASLGIGMACPYVVVGVYPELLRFLPRPGRWMETFKQFTGFILLATVVFILSFMEPAAVVPTVALLVGIGAACWVVSRTPLTAELRDRLQAWGTAGAVVLLFVAVSFGWLYRDVMQPRFEGQRTARASTAAGAAWHPFSLERLKELAVDGGRTVLVDFSADWCFNCKVLEQAVLHTEGVKQAIAKSGAATMYADYTDYPQEITRTIGALRASGVPVIAVFPGDRPYEPIVFRGGYTQNGLIEALEKATGRRLRPEGGAVAEATAVAAPLN